MKLFCLVNSVKQQKFLFAKTHLFCFLGYASSEPFTVGGETFAFVYNPSGGGCNGRVAHHGITFVLEVCYTSAAKDECKPWGMLQPRVETELWNTILAYFGRKACFGAFITPNSMLSSHVTNIFCEPIQLRSWQSRQSKPHRRRATRVWAPAIGTGLSLLNCWDWTRLDYQRISGMMNLGFLVWHLGLELLYPSWSYACAEWYVCLGLLRSFMRMMTESPSDTAAWQHCSLFGWSWACFQRCWGVVLQNHRFRHCHKNCLDTPALYVLNLRDSVQRSKWKMHGNTRNLYQEEGWRFCAMGKHWGRAARQRPI